MKDVSCSKCGESYPHTSDYFGKDARCKNGLRKVCKVCLAKYQKRMRIENPEMIREINRRAYQNNLDARRAYRNRSDVRKKHYEHTADWKSRNPEKARELGRRYSYRRRQIIRSYDGDVMTADEWNGIVEKYGNKCLCCGCEFSNDVSPTVDHVVPVSLGGSLAVSNVQPLCGSCNSSKADKIIDYRKMQLAWPF